MVFSSGGISMRSIFSSSLMRLCTCLALVACARKRLMKASSCSMRSRWLRVGGLQLRAALGLLRQILVVVAGVEVDPLVPDLGDLVDRDVEEVAVVRNQDEGIRDSSSR